MACARSSPIAEAEPPYQLAGVFVLLVDGQAHAQAEFGVVFEQRVGPGRAAAVLVGAVGRGGQVAAVDGGAAGGVGDHHAVAEQLGQQLDVGRFAAAGAGAGELEQGLEQLHVLHLVEREHGALGLGNLQEEVPVGGFAFAQRRLGHHVDGAVLDFALALGGADLHAEGAAGAIFGRHLQGVLALLHILPAGRNGFEGGRRAGEGRFVVDLGADHAVGADQHALAALDAELLVPLGNFEGDVALLPLRGADGEGAIDGHGADRQIVAFAGDDHGRDLLHESGGGGGHVAGGDRRWR